MNEREQHGCKFENKNIIKKKELNPIKISNTRQLVNRLIDELNKFKSQLAKVFPERIIPLTYKELSRFWRDKEFYIKTMRQTFTKKGAYNIKHENIDLLRNNLINSYSFKNIRNCLNFINKYENDEIDVLMLTDFLVQELGKLSDNILITQELLSNLFGFHEQFMTDIKVRNSKWTLSHEHFEFFIKNIRSILGEKAIGCMELIEKYKNNNPNMKRYINQHVTIKSPLAFKILNEEIAYWLGFLCADAYLRKIKKNKKDYALRIVLSRKDRHQLKYFSYLVGFDVSRINDYQVFRRYKGEIRIYEVSEVRFGSKELYNDLVRLGFFNMRGNMNARRLPDKIVFSNNNCIAFAFLLGFFDGDGTYYRNTNNARIYSSSKQVLEQIKELFNIKHDVKKYKISNTFAEITDEIKDNNIIREVKYSYYLVLDRERYEQMINSYSGGLNRKRPLDFTLSSNFSGW